MILTFSTTDSLFHEKTLPYSHRRLRLKTYNRWKATVTSTVGTVNLTLRRQNDYICYPIRWNRIIFLGRERGLQSS